MTLLNPLVEQRIREIVREEIAAGPHVVIAERATQMRRDARRLDGESISGAIIDSINLAIAEPDPRTASKSHAEVGSLPETARESL